jgi:hypothetical protein
MLQTLPLDRPLPIPGTGSTGPVPPGAERVEQLIEWIGIAIFVALAISAAVILIRYYLGSTERH